MENTNLWEAFKFSGSYRDAFCEWKQFMRSEGYEPPFTAEEFEQTSTCTDAFNLFKEEHKGIEYMEGLKGGLEPIIEIISEYSFGRESSTVCIEKIQNYIYKTLKDTYGGK